jgi:hypothetical protein
MINNDQLSQESRPSETAVNHPEDASLVKAHVAHCFTSRLRVKSVIAVERFGKAANAE